MATLNASQSQEAEDVNAEIESERKEDEAGDNRGEKGPAPPQLSLPCATDIANDPGDADAASIPSESSDTSNAVPRMKEDYDKWVASDTSTDYVEVPQVDDLDLHSSPGDGSAQSHSSAVGGCLSPSSYVEAVSVSAPGSDAPVAGPSHGRAVDASGPVLEGLFKPLPAHISASELCDSIQYRLQLVRRSFALYHEDNLKTRATFLECCDRGSEC